MHQSASKFAAPELSAELEKHPEDVVIVSSLDIDSRSSLITDDVRTEFGDDAGAVAAGTEARQRMRALHTPLHEVTVGSGCSDRTHT